VTRKPLHRRLRGALLPLLALALWWAACRFHWTDSKLFVPPAQVLRTAWRMAAGGELWQALGASLQRDLIGFAIGGSAGFVVGGAMALSRGVDAAVGPSFHAVKQVSILAWIPLISLWFGLGEAAKVAFLSLAAFFPMVLNTYEGIRGVPLALVEMGRALAFTRWQMLTRVVLPAALPSIFTGVYLALLYSWLATLGAEYLLTSGAGIGNLLVDGREHFWMDQVLLGVLVVGAVGFVLNSGAARIESRLLRWRPVERRA
jgi:sulfonate transport system permease protein